MQRIGRAALAAAIALTGCGPGGRGGGGGADRDAAGRMDGGRGGDPDASGAGSDEARVRASLPEPTAEAGAVADAIDWDGLATEFDCPSIREAPAGYDLVGSAPFGCPDTSSSRTAPLPDSWDALPSGRYLLLAAWADGRVDNFLLDHPPLDLDVATLADICGRYRATFPSWYFCAGSRWPDVEVQCGNCPPTGCPDLFLLYYAEYVSDADCSSGHRPGEGCITGPEACSSLAYCPPGATLCRDCCNLRECGPSPECGGVTCGDCPSGESCSSGTCGETGCCLRCTIGLRPPDNCCGAGCPCDDVCTDTCADSC